MNIDEAWNVLVALGGASEELRENFRYAVEEHPSRLPFEYRFQGHFGFGGKVRLREGYFQADYYPEDRTDEREVKLRTLNHNLARLNPRPGRKA
jgi:hypothetical protein